MFERDKKFLFTLFILIGGVIGAGIFAIPYVVVKSGIIPGLFYLFVLAGAILLIHLLFGEVVLRTEKNYRLPGLARKYTGKLGETMVVISTFVGGMGALLAYLIVAGDFLKIAFSSFIPLDSFYFSILFWLSLVFFIFRGVKAIAPTEIFSNLLFFSIILIVSLFALPKFNVSNFSAINLPNIFLPYGVILFSYLSLASIPEMGAMLKTSEEKKLLKKSIIASFAIVLVFYLFFTAIIIGTSGQATSPEALQGLFPFVGTNIVILAALAAVTTLADSFLVIALHLRNVLINDYRFPKIVAFLIACGSPLVLFLFGFRNFIETIGFVGTIVGAIQGVMIVLIFKKAKKMGDRVPEYSLKIPSFVLCLLLLLFVLGALAQGL